MLADELRHVLSRGTEGSDDRDEAIAKTLRLVTARASYIAARERGCQTDQNDRTVAVTLLTAYYRHIYMRSSNYGGICFVCQKPGTLFLLRVLIHSLLGMREIDAEHIDAEVVCPAMRGSKEALPYMPCRLIYGLPFRELMSWDVSNIMSSCDLSESLLFSTSHPSKWDVRASQKGEVIRIERMLSEVVDLSAIVRDMRRK